MKILFKMCTKISVIIPCYNQAIFLSKALDSLFAQSYNDWEAVIINDGSTDNTEQVAKDYTARDKRIKYYYQENFGASAARNYGVKMALGGCIVFLDADDWLAPSALQEVHSYMAAHRECKMFNLRSMWVDAKTGVQIAGHVYKDYRYCLVYGQDNKVAIRRTAFEEVGGFDTTMRHGFEDWEFYVRLLNKDSIVKVSDEVLYYYRINVSDNNVSSIGERNKQSAMNYIYQKNMDKYVAVLGSPQLQYQWADRKLPQFVLKLQLLYQKVYNSLRQ